MIKARAQLTIGSSSWLRNTLKSVMLFLRNESFRSSIWRPEFVPRSGASLMSIIITSLVMKTPCVTKTIFFAPDPASNKGFYDILSFGEALVVVSFWAYLPDVTLSGCCYYCHFWLLFFELLPKGRPPWRLGVFGIGFCTLCFCFPTKMLHLNAPFFPLKSSVSPPKCR